MNIDTVLGEQLSSFQITYFIFFSQSVYMPRMDVLCLGLIFPNKDSLNPSMASLNAL